MNLKTLADPLICLPARVFWPAWILALAAAVVSFLEGMLWLKSHHAAMAWVMAVTAIYCLVILALSVLPGLRGIRSGRTPASPATKRYVKRFMLAMSGYVAVLMVTIFTFINLKPAGPLAWLLALAPTVPLAASMAAIGVYLAEEKDEFQRAIQVQSMLWAMGGAFMVATAWGFLETFNQAPHAPAWAIYPLWALLMAPAQMIVRRRYT